MKFGKFQLFLKCELEWKKYSFKSILSKIDGKGKKFNSIEDVQKVLSTIYSDINSLKQWENKAGNIVLSKKEELNFGVVDIIKKDSIRKPWAPFTTSTIQQEAARKFGFWGKANYDGSSKIIWMNGFMKWWNRRFNHIYENW